MSKLSRWLPFLNWPRPTPALLRGESMAALTVAVVMIPQSVAYAGLAGMPLVTGLYATFLPALIAVLFSASTRLSVGPSALSSVLVGASLVGLAQPASASWVALAVWLALLAGGLQLAVGLTRSAWVLNLVSSPVLTGFSQAAALLIIASQLPTLVGLRGSLGQLLHEPQFDLQALAYGLTSLVLFVGAKRVAPRLPIMLIALAGAGAISYFSGYSRDGAVVGALPQGLPAPYWPGWPGWDQFSTLLAPAFVLALVSSLEMAASAKIENQRERRRWDANQDLVGQGMGKLASAFSGAFATSTSFSRSALTLYSGAKTGWATVVASGFVLLVLLFLTPALSHVPTAVLAAVVVAAVASLFKPTTFWTLWQIDKVEAMTAGVTFAVTLLTAPRIYWGVLTGVLVGWPTSCSCACTRASSRWGCTRTAACATATSGSCRRWRRSSMPCAWTRNSTSLPPPPWNGRSWSTWSPTPTCATCACSRSRSTASMRPAWRCSGSCARCWPGAGPRCTSSASSCRWSACCEGRRAGGEPAAEDVRTDTEALQALAQPAARGQSRRCAPTPPPTPGALRWPSSWPRSACA